MRLRISKIIFTRKKKCGELTFPNFKTYYKAAMSKQCGRHKDRHIDQKNRIESSSKLYIYGQWIFSNQIKKLIQNGSKI